MLFWNVPAPDEALLISGSKRSGDESQFKIVTGHGAFVLPVLRKARYISLALREAQIDEQCVSQQGIPLKMDRSSALRRRASWVRDVRGRRGPVPRRGRARSRSLCSGARHCTWLYVNGPSATPQMSSDPYQPPGTRSGPTMCPWPSPAPCSAWMSCVKWAAYQSTTSVS
jgi:hypothetical protein